MKYYTIKQVAEMFGVSPHTIERRRKQGKYPHSRKNGRWAIPECCVAPNSTCLDGGSPGGAVKVDDELIKITREADLAEQVARKAKAEDKTGEAKQSTAVRSAGLSVEQLKAKEKELETTLLEMEGLMAKMVAIKEKQGLIFGDEFKAEWDNLWWLVQKLLGREVENLEAE